MFELSACRRVAFAAVSVLLTSVVAAQDRPFHVEANLGQASVDDVDGLPIDDADTAYRLATGYAFLDWFGITGGFVDLGTVEASIDISGPGTPLPIEASADGFEVTLSGRLTLTDALAVTVNAGIFWWTSDTRIAGAADSDSGNDSTWGLGAEYALRPDLAVTAGWRRYTVDDVDADAAWLGLMVRFGEAD